MIVIHYSDFSYFAKTYINSYVVKKLHIFIYWLKIDLIYVDDTILLKLMNLFGNENIHICTNVEKLLLLVYKTN